MGHRLTKIYTRTGDDGTTGLTGGGRIAKDHPRVEAMGAVDELNSALGVLLTESLDAGVRQTLLKVQHQLFDLGGELSMPGETLVHGSDVKALEKALDHYNADLPPLKDFILPGGGRAGAYCHIARGICRRAERRMVTLGAAEQLSPGARQYLNRLSDLLFVLARVLNRDSGHPDVLWQRD